MSQSGRVALFIDGASLHAAAKALGFNVDFRKLLAEFQVRGRLLRAFYYISVFEDQEVSSTRPLIDWLSYNGYTVVTKVVKESGDGSGRRKMKSGLSTELAVNVFEMSRYLDEIVLFTGDGDVRPLVEAVQRHGVRVAVVSTIAVHPPMIADDLRRQADCFIELAELRSNIGRDV